MESMEFPNWTAARWPAGFRVALLVAAALVVFGQARAQEETPEEEMHIHRFQSETTSPYDAFAYLNRIPKAPAEGQSAVDYAGTIIFSRLSNLEGRIQVKIVDGFDKSAYLGFKTFLRAWPEEGGSVGNCVSCHTQPEFTDEKEYVVDESGQAKATPSLWNLGKSDDELEAVIRGKLAAAEQARQGEAESIAEAYKLIQLNDADVQNLVKFVQSLNEVSHDEFRQIVVEAEILDTSEMIE